MMERKHETRIFALAILIVVASGCAGDGPGEPAPTVTSGPIAMRRLTEAQYRATIAEVLGGDIDIAGRIEPDNRRLGLLAVGASFVSVTASGFEQYEAIARNVAAQALDVDHRDALVACVPATSTAADDNCAEQFVRRVGRRLWRRPLADAEVQGRVAVARESATALNDFYAGLDTALTSLLMAPEFLFRLEQTEPEPSHPSGRRLTSLAMASRLSFFLWNAPPDDELLAAGERGELVDEVGLATQVDRLLASPRVEESVRAFFADLFAFEDIEHGLVRKDPVLFPAFSQTLINDAREQTLRVIVQHLLTEDGDYRDLFTTRRSFMTRPLGLVYRVPVQAPMGWEAYEFPPGDDRGGLLTHVSLLALYSHPGRSSPTLRGKFVREVLLCQDVPPPPGNIDFSMFSDSTGANRRTARQRLSAHVANEACAGCHSLMDPIGLGLENFDGIGIQRATENGDPIDASGALDQMGFSDAVSLGRALASNPALGPCFIESWYRYALGRDAVEGERAYLTYLANQLSQSGYRVRDLLRRLALSDAFRTTSGPRAASNEPEPQATPTAVAEEVTFAQLQQQIFTPRCATQFCHDATTQAAAMVLDANSAFENLLGVAPTNPTANGAGMLRVDPLDPDNSYLVIKLQGPNTVELGARMPLIGTPLTEAQIDLIRQWIEEGANP